MKNGDERNSCFVLITHSQSPFSRDGSATGFPGVDSSAEEEEDAADDRWVATRASTL
jgi:hypothetical protein